MKTILAAIVIFLGMFSLPAQAAVVEARIDISEQKMRVYKHGKLKYVWPVSTARRGK